MLGGNMLAGQLRDLRAVLVWLRGRGGVDAARFGLWGDSLAKLNPPEFVPGEHDEKQVDYSNWPNKPYGQHWIEPLGQLLAMLGALFEEDVRAVFVRNGLVALVSLFDFHFFCVPSDTIVPGCLNAGDLCDLAASLALGGRIGAGALPGGEVAGSVVEIDGGPRFASAVRFRPADRGR